MANEDVLERFGWDGEEGLIFDRTKPFGDSTPEKGPLYEEVTTFDLIEIANDLAAALREAREKQKQLEARVAELEEDGCWLSERCASCGHRFAYPADHCPQCGVKVGPNEPDVYPELCECPRCIVARNVAMDAAMKPPGGEK